MLITFETMNKYSLVLCIAITLMACKNAVESISPTVEPITQSVYASGIVKSDNQYQVFATVNGIIKEIYVKEGDTVSTGTPLFSIVNDASRLAAENARLAAQYADFDANKDKLKELKIAIETARVKLTNDSLLYVRQRELWAQQIGTRVEFEQRELAYQTSLNTYQSAVLRYNDTKKQLLFASQQSKKNLAISQKQESDFTVRSEINGRVYTTLKKRGEMVNPQIPLAIVGDANGFMLELQVDEYDIVNVRVGQNIVVRLDSYRGQTFEAKVSRIDPFMNERSKTFLVEAIFTKQPPVLYPNLTVESNIVIAQKDQALTIPRTYLKNDSIVKKADGTEVVVTTGLKDYSIVEILSGLSINDKLIKP